MNKEQSKKGKGKQMKKYNNMTMNRELITPIVAREMLKDVGRNRSVSPYTVEMYANDMATGKWDENVGAAISIDKNGTLRDGQHRLRAIIKSGKSIWMWVCRGVDTYGMYDNNRRRTTSDQINYGTDHGFEKVYATTQYIGVAKMLISNLVRKNISPKEVIEFTSEHKKDLDGYWLNIPRTNAPKINIVAVHTALYSAYMNGVYMQDITNFYNVLTSGMSANPEEYPIIAYRNYLKDRDVVKPLPDELARCQYALKKYLTGSCTKTSKAPNKLIWPLPYQEN